MGLLRIITSTPLLLFPFLFNGFTCEAQDVSAQCDVVINEKNCDQSRCEELCGLYGTSFLIDKGKCCSHIGKSATLLAFEEAELWVPRIEEFNRCTGSSVKITYLEEGEDGMAEALIRDVGDPDNPDSGEGIYDAYIVQAPWLPAVESGLASLNDRIKENDDYINYQDINPASRDAISWNGTVKALPLDTDYIAIGWREDVFKKHGLPLIPPRTVEELVEISEKLNGLDHNDDGEPDWGFCLTPQVNYFYSFVAPIFQTSLRQCDDANDKTCSNGRKTGQNLFFDSDTFEPLIFNEGFRLALKLYWRLIRSSNCQTQIPAGEKCSRKTAFPTGRCAGVVSMPGTLTKMIKEGEKYSIKPRVNITTNKTIWHPGQNLESSSYWGRRARMPGSKQVIKWNSGGEKKDQKLLALVDCEENINNCPHAENGVNYSPFFSEGGESYALNGKQSKPISRDLMFDLFTWMSELPITELPMAGQYRKSHLFAEQSDVLQDAGWPEVMINDLFAVLDVYFLAEEDGGHPVQDLLLLGFADYMGALDTELHDKLLLGAIENGGLLNTTNVSQSIDPENKADSEFFDSRYDTFINTLASKYNNITSRISGGQLKQLERWRQSLNLVWKPPTELCTNVLVLKDYTAFDRLNCLSVVDIETLCLTKKEYVEGYNEGLCGSYAMNLNQIGSYRWVGFGLAFIVIILAICCAVWTYIYRNSHVIRASQPPFLLWFCLGVIIMSTAIFPLSIDDSFASQRGCNIACMATPWLFFPGFAVIFSALFSKIWRVNRLLDGASNFKRIKVTMLDVIWPFVIILVLNLCLLLGWTFGDPLVWIRVERDDVNSYGICAAKGNVWIVFVVLLTAVNIGAMVLACVQAYKARAVDDALSESKYIGLAMMSMLEMAIIGIPMMIILKDNPSAKFAVAIGAITIICISLLLLIFVPKRYLSKQNPSNRRSLGRSVVAHRPSMAMSTDSTGGRRQSMTMGSEMSNEYNAPHCRGTLDTLHNTQEEYIPEPTIEEPVSVFPNSAEYKLRVLADQILELKKLLQEKE